MGLFYRTIRMVDNGIKPVYVFDGKPPDMKGGELTKRAEKREEASKQLALATETGTFENFLGEGEKKVFVLITAHRRCS